MARTELQHVRDWLKALGSLCAGATTQGDANAKIGAYAPLLAADFSQGAFSPASLAAVARQCKFFPSYAELCEYLGSWWIANRPEPTVRALPDPRTKTNEDWRIEAELSWAVATQEQVRAKVADIESVPVKAQRDALGRMLAHAIANHAPRHLGLVPPQWQEPMA